MQCLLVIFVSGHKTDDDDDDDSESDEQQLREGIDELRVWTENWLLNLNISKCKVISFGRTVDKSHTYNITDSDVIPIDWVNKIKDLGILIDEKLTFRDHIHDKINKAYMVGPNKTKF